MRRGEHPEPAEPLRDYLRRREIDPPRWFIVAYIGFAIASLWMVWYGVVGAVAWLLGAITSVFSGFNT